MEFYQEGSAQFFSVVRLTIFRKQGNKPAGTGRAAASGGIVSSNSFAPLQEDDSSVDTSDHGPRIEDMAPAVNRGSNASNDNVMGYGLDCLGFARDACKWNADLTHLDGRQYLVVIDSGATEHMWVRKSDFVSYDATPGAYVIIANDDKVPCLGRGTVRFYLNGKLIEITNVLHVPSLRSPLYSVRQHRRYESCSFVGDNSGMFLTFPEFTVEIDDSEDCVAHATPAVESRLTTPDYTARYARARAVTTRGQRRAKARQQARADRQVQKLLKNRKLLRKRPLNLSIISQALFIRKKVPVPKWILNKPNR